MKIITLMEDSPGKGKDKEGLLYEHGLSLYIETKNHKVLLDTGASEKTLVNAKALGIDLSEIDTVILSHGHYDHSGGILPFVRENDHAKIYMRENAGGEFFHTGRESARYIGIDLEILKLPQVVLLKGDYKIDEELSIFTNITGRRLWPTSNISIREKQDDKYVQDEFSHEQCLVVSEGGKRALLSGCAHNGILNIVDKYHEIYGDNPDLVISGFHMVKKRAYKEEEIADIKATGAELLKTGAYYATGHCTGMPAFEILKEVMGDKLSYASPGTEFTLQR